MSDWQDRVAAVWAQANSLSEDEVVARIDALVSERPPEDALALFAAAGARDFSGREADAEPLYRRALANGLPEPQRAQAVIQLASTVRNLHRSSESVDLLRAELAAHPDHELADAARAFLALAMLDVGETSEAARLALATLAGRLPQYGRAVAAYAADA